MYETKRLSLMSYHKSTSEIVITIQVSFEYCKMCTESTLLFSSWKKYVSSYACNYFLKFIDSLNAHVHFTSLKGKKDSLSKVIGT